MKTNPNNPPEQDRFQEAIHTFDRDVIVVANAGSGKTQLLVEHYYALLSEGYEPAQILAFTFTEKAANELRERIFSGFRKNPSFRELGEEWVKAWRGKIQESFIGTIHQFCLRVLLEGRDSQQIKSYRIIDEATEVQLREIKLNEALRDFLQKKNPDAELLLKTYGIRNFQELLRQFMEGSPGHRRTESVSLPALEEQEARLMKAIERLAEPIIGRFNLEKEKKGWLSFDDLEFRALLSISEPSKKIRNFLSRFSHMLVDEFQDTSPIQIKIIEGIRKQFAASKIRPKLFCVGDPKQSIYRFRNVDRKLIELSEKRTLQEGGRHFDFTNNYRSTPTVLKLINSYAQKAFPESIQSVPTRNESKDARAAIVTLNPNKKLGAEEVRNLETAWVADMIKKINSGGLALEKIAVLYRASSSAVPLTHRLRERGIPFTIRGGQELFKRQEILDLKHLLYFLNNPKDRISLAGILRSPIFLISDASLYHLTRFTEKTDLFQYLLSGKYRSDLKSVYPDEIAKMDWSVSALSKLLRKSETSTAHTLLRDFMNEYRLGDLLARGAEDTDALLAIEQWLDWVRQIEGENAPMGIRKFVALLKQLEKTPILKAPLGDIIGHENCVQLLTIHAAKGLQFDTVFLIDLIRRPPPSSYLMQRLGGEFALKIPDADNETMETDRFQAIKAYHAEEEIEENKRLLYVALSRAENQLFVCLSQANAAKNNLQSLLLTCLDNYKDAFETISYENVEEKDQEKPRTDGESQEEIKFLGVKKSEEAPVVCNVSELETFALCPLKHHFSYTQQLSDEKWDAADQIDVTKMGTFLHSALNFLHGNPEMSSDEAIRKILINPILWGNEAAIAQLSDYLENYLKSPLYKKILSALEDYSELPFILESPSGKVRGQIDRLIRTDQGWTLIDFKLSSKKPTAADLLKDYDFQLKTYTLAAQRILKRTIPMVEIHLLGVPKLFRFEFSLEELNRHRIHIEDLLNRLKAPALDQVRFMDICRTCPFNRHVPICPVPAKPAA